MKKSNNKKTRDVTAFIYPRLSRDDNLEGESYSISNHLSMLLTPAPNIAIIQPSKNADADQAAA